MDTDNFKSLMKVAHLYLQEYMTQEKVGLTLGVSTRQVSQLLQECITTPEFPIDLAKKIITKTCQNSTWKTGGYNKKLKEKEKKLLEQRAMNQRQNLCTEVQRLKALINRLEKDLESLQFVATSYSDYSFEEFDSDQSIGALEMRCEKITQDSKLAQQQLEKLLQAS